MVIARTSSKMGDLDLDLQGQTEVKRSKKKFFIFVRNGEKIEKKEKKLLLKKILDLENFSLFFRFFFYFCPKWREN